MTKIVFKQGHHHNGDQAARRPYMMGSICSRRFAITQFGVGMGRGLAQLITSSINNTHPLQIYTVYCFVFLSIYLPPKCRI